MPVPAFPELTREKLEELLLAQNARVEAFDAAASRAITALAFAVETYQRAGDAVALAQTLGAKEALIAAQNKARATPQRVCMAPIPGANNLCTRDFGHEGEHRCLWIDVETRRRSGYTPAEMGAR